MNSFLSQLKLKLMKIYLISWLYNCTKLLICNWNYGNNYISISWHYKLMTAFSVVFIFPAERISSQKKYYKVIFRFLIIMRIGDEIFDQNIRTHQRYKMKNAVEKLLQASYGESFVEEIVRVFSTIGIPHQLKHVRFNLNPVLCILWLLYFEEFTNDKNEEFNNWIHEAVIVFLKCQLLEFTDGLDKKEEYQKIFYFGTVNLGKSFLSIDKTVNISREKELIGLCSLMKLLDDLTDLRCDHCKQPNYFHAREDLSKIANYPAIIQLMIIKKRQSSTFNEWFVEYKKFCKTVKSCEYLFPNFFLGLLKFKYFSNLLNLRK